MPGQRNITVPPKVEAAVIVHEFGHVMEAESGAHFQAAVNFLSRRTGFKESDTNIAQSAKPLSALTGQGYSKSERALEDRLKNPYTAKVYEASGPGSYKGLGATEVTSMGLERMYRDPVEFAREDPDHFRFTLEQMSRKSTPRA